MKKVISILVSVMMILTAIPAFADTAATAPASVDIYEALDNFSEDELATTYTSSAPYTTASGFKAPVSSSMTATLCEDDERTYVHTQMNRETNPNAGINIFNSDIEFGSDAQYDDTISYEVTFRTNNIRSSLYWYFLNSTGNRIGSNYPLRIYGQGGNTLYTYANGYVSGADAFDLANNVWYTLKFSVDLGAKTFTIFVNGGEYENYSWTATLKDAFINTIASNDPISGVGFGYLSTVSADSYIDIDNIGLSNTSISFDDKLTFEETSMEPAISSATNWKSGNWSSNFSEYADAVTLENTDGAHGKSLKFTNVNGGHYQMLYTFPAGVADSGEDVIIVEGSYNSHTNGQPRLWITGKNSSGSDLKWQKIMDHPSSTGGTTYLFKGDKTDVITPIDGQWRRIRFIFDLKNDTIEYSQWAENNPSDVEVVSDGSGMLADFAAIKNIWFYPYQKTFGNSATRMYIDDLRVYKPDALRYIGSNPANGEGFSVSEEVNPSILFNMPIASTTATTDNVYLLDSDGNRVNGTVGLSAQRNGVSFYPAKALESDKAYTLVANCAVTDEFGSTLAVNKTIKFETSPILNMIDFKFMQNGEEVEALANSALNAQIELKSRANEYRNIYAALAIYNKSTGELVSINTGSINAVTNTFNLTATVPAEGTYYAKAFVWNTDANAVPYFTAQSIGLN